MKRPPKKYVCEKCGYLGDTSEHEGCDYLAWTTGEQLYIDHLERELALLKASPASASVAAPDYRIADRGFRWDAENRQHIPQLLIEFTPVPENAPNASSGWKDRDKLAAMLVAAPVLNRIKESNDDVLVMDALRSGEWRITKSIPCECLTDEANAKSAWYVERMCAPFCDDKNFRSWFGRTPIEALSNGKDAIRARADELEKTNG